MHETVGIGDRVSDPIAGFEGIVMSRTEYLFGCVRVAVQGPDVDGKATESRFYDEPGVDVVERRVYVPTLSIVQQQDPTESLPVPRAERLRATGGPDRDRDPRDRSL